MALVLAVLILAAAPAPIRQTLIGRVSDGLAPLATATPAISAACSPDGPFQLQPVRHAAASEARFVDPMATSSRVPR